jgi:hypothetical protein
LKYLALLVELAILKAEFGIGNLSVEMSIKVAICFEDAVYVQSSRQTMFTTTYSFNHGCGGEQVVYVEAIL